VNAYSFQYDKLNRLKQASYGSGDNGATWDDEAGKYNEGITYDVMGNILTLLRSGNNKTSDNLSYDYIDMSNKLKSVTSSSSSPVGFNDGYKAGIDYLYDANGNLTTDKNKGLEISYNFLNLPKSVKSSDKTIDYTYDATGKKLKKTFDGNTHYYFDGIEYDDAGLLFAMTEEGRVRKKDDGSYVYDYFLKDHLGNVRVVLNADTASQAMVYPAASMETMTAATETTYYSNLDRVRSFTPVGFKSIKKNEKVAHLKGTDPNKQIGPSITVKVNSGDKISLTAQSFYPDNTGSQRTGLAETALSQLVNAMINPSGLNGRGKAMAAEALRAQGFEKGNGYRDMMNKLPNSDYKNENDRPKAYMVWMLFDKQMKLVKTGRSSGARQIPEGAGQVKQMAENDILMDQGGFLTAYTVNESPSSVYIDNFQMSTVSGSLIEENSYYPFGMLNNGLSSQDYSDTTNNYKYNGKELQKELSLNWLDYGARFYDPVIGRWHSVDPLAEVSRRWSPYTYGMNNPIRLIDPDGRSSTSPDDYFNRQGQYTHSTSEGNNIVIQDNEVDSKLTDYTLCSGSWIRKKCFSYYQ
jgi:RHS repeat-associated protein